MYISIKNLFPKLYDVIPGWIRGTYYCVTGATGTGKSKFARYAFAEWTYKYCIANNIPFKVIYFALEESADFFWTTVRLDKFKEDTGVDLTYYQYKGYHAGMTDEHSKQLSTYDSLINDMKKYIKVYDDVFNPTGLLETIKTELKDVGKSGVVDTFTDAQGNVVTITKFVYDDPNFHLVVVADHIGLMSPEKHQFDNVTTLHAAISKWSEYVVKIICKKYNAIVVNVHQQEMAGENNDSFKLGKLEPTEAKLGDNKIIGRDFI